MNKYIIYWLIVLYLTIYAFLKQRQEYGCDNTLFTIQKQCDEDKSVYLINTQINKNNSYNFKQLSEKLESILGYHEKGAIWRICLLMANIMTFFVFIIFNTNDPIKDLIPLHLSFIYLMYFYFNYINYHHFRRLKNNGVVIINKMNEICNNNK